jgi:hypothetical protein
MNKSESQGFVNQLLVYTLVMICFSGTIGLGTVWLRQQMAQTANNVKVLESRSSAVERHLAEMNALIAAESSADVLNRRNQEWSLGLVRPQERQIVRVFEPVEDRLARKRHDQLFAGERATVAPVRFVLGGDGQ